MKLSKAIKILNDHVHWCDPKNEVDTLDALKLGIEALKELQKARNGNPALDVKLLPGETD